MNKTKKYIVTNQAIYIGINYFLHNLKKYVKIWLFRTSLNKTRKFGVGPKMAENGQNPLILNAPPHIKQRTVKGFKPKFFFMYEGQNKIFFSV